MRNSHAPTAELKSNCDILQSPGQGGDKYVKLPALSSDTRDQIIMTWCKSHG